MPSKEFLEALRAKAVIGKARSPERAARVPRPRAADEEPSPPPQTRSAAIGAYLRACPAEEREVIGMIEDIFGGRIVEVTVNAKAPDPHNDQGQQSPKG